MDIRGCAMKGNGKYVESKTTAPKPTPVLPKLIQVPVIKGFGEKRELVVKEITIAPPNPPVFRIIDIDKEVTITNYKIVTSDCDKATVILDGFVDKNILYKTITDNTTDSVGGPVFQFTTRVDFATFVEVRAREEILSTDHVEILNAVVEGENDELLDPNAVAVGLPSFAITYNTILEKMIVKVELKIVRTEHVSV
jgi:hypothetical protein